MAREELFYDFPTDSVGCVRIQIDRTCHSIAPLLFDSIQMNNWVWDPTDTFSNYAITCLCFPQRNRRGESAGNQTSRQIIKYICTLLLKN